MTTLQETPTKETILTLLREWINQRPGLEPANYGFPAYSREQWKEANRAYTSEARRITKQLHDARRLLRVVELSGVTAEELVQAFEHGFSGRLSLKQNEKGYYLDYCTGQYWPTEYRAAACAVLASALWEYHRPDYMNDERPGDSLRAMFRRMFDKGLQSRWLD